MSWPCTGCSHLNSDDADPFCAACGAQRGAVAPAATPAPLPAVPGGAAPSPSPAASASGYALRVLRGQAAGQMLGIPDQPVVTVGRAPDDDVLLADSTISRHHARLHRTAAGQLSIDDCGSSGTGSANGTYIGAQLVTAGQPMPIQEGDRLLLGQSVELELMRA